ncbi:MAG: PAS domain S-box protein [Candidatus Methylomirabilales bacterium]
MTQARGSSPSDTTRKPVPTTLLEDHGITRALLEFAMVAIVVTDRDGRIVLVNAQTEKLFGYHRDELLGQTVEILLPERLRNVHAGHRRNYTAQPHVRSMGLGLDLFGCRKDGSEFPAEIGLSPIDTQDGSLTLGFITDTSERRRADDALRQSEARFRSLVETTSDWVWEVDPTGVYTYASPKVKELLGYEPADIIGKRLFDLMPPDEAQRATTFFQDIVRSRKPFASFENTNLHKDGHRVVLETSGIPILDASGNLVGYRGIDRDITERKRLEQEIRDRECLQDILRFKSEFVANVSHELRTPLNSIIGFSELLTQRIPGELNAKQVKYLNHILVSAQHLLALIIDILDLSKAEAGRIELEPEVFYLSDAVETTLTTVRPQASKKQIALTSDIAPESTTITADPLRFNQIMYNLLSNAVKFTQAGGTVTVSARRVHGSRFTVHGRDETDHDHSSTSHARDGDFIEISVKDTGIGISPEDQEKLFQEFSQVGGKHASREYGTGLGLALTKKLVELHGGRIGVESAGEGTGSTFFFTMPASAPPPAGT